MLLTTLFSLRALFTKMLGGGYNYVRVLLKFLLYFRTNNMVFATSFSNSSAKSSCNKKGTIFTLCILQFNWWLAPFCERKFIWRKYIHSIR